MAPTFSIEITLGNAAMQTQEDVAAALERVAKRLKGGDEEGSIKDINGNTVGNFAGDFETEGSGS